MTPGTFGYDHVSRLTGLSWYGPGAGYGGSSGYFEQLAWGYDSDSRVATLTNNPYPNENLSYTYDHDSQLTSAAASYGGYGGGVGGGTYGWDANGDTTNSGWVTGKGNRLLKDSTYHYWYDSDLIGRSITVNGVTTTARFVYDLASADALPGGEASTLPSPLGGEGVGVRGSGNAVLAFNGNESLTDRYFWGPAVDQILADERLTPSGSNWMPTGTGGGGTVYWALGDNEGSVRDWISYGSLVDHIVYDSFGKIYSQTSSANGFAYLHNGVYYDSATGLEYHNDPSSGAPGRWYNPAIQRWMSADPLGLGPDADPYRYNLNSPTNFIDPSGHDAVFVGGGGEQSFEQEMMAEWIAFEKFIVSLEQALGLVPLTGGLAGGHELPSMHSGPTTHYGLCYGGRANESEWMAANQQYAEEHNRRAKRAFEAFGIPTIMDPNDPRIGAIPGFMLSDDFNNATDPNFDLQQDRIDRWRAQMPDRMRAAATGGNLEASGYSDDWAGVVGGAAAAAYNTPIAPISTAISGTDAAFGTQLTTQQRIDLLINAGMQISLMIAGGVFAEGIGDLIDLGEAGLGVGYGGGADAGASSGLGSAADTEAPIQGGSYETVRAANSGGETHHMPAKSANPNLHPDDGPAIHMDAADHAQTASYDGGSDAIAYRGLQAQLIEQGRFMEAVEMDIQNIRDLFLDKYDVAIQQMLNYIKTIGINGSGGVSIE